MKRLLGSVCPLGADLALEPLSYAAFAECAQHTRHSAPGPDCVSYDAWVQCGEAGMLVLYKAYLAILEGAEVPA